MEKVEYPCGRFTAYRRRYPHRPEARTVKHTVPITQYGTYVTVSDQLELHAVDDVILGAAEELGASAGSTMDKIARNVLCQGTNVIYADKIGEDGTATEVASREELDKTAKLTPAMVNKAVTYLKKMKAPKIDGKYMAIIHPSVGYDLPSERRMERSP